MKKVSFLILIMSMFVLVSCNDTTTTTESTRNHIVSFETNGGNEIESVEVESNLSWPDNPTKDNHDFLGWYSDSDFNNRFDFSSTVNQDLTLYAKWEFTGIRIGVMLPSINELRWHEQSFMFEEALEALGDGYEYEIMFSDQDELTEINNAQFLIDHGVEVIILSAVGSGNTIVEMANEEGVTLISHERLAQGNVGSSDYYVTYNAWDVGVAQGQHLVDMAIENGCSEANPCDLAMFSGRVFDWPKATYFYGGAMEVLVPEFDMFNIINVDEQPFVNLVNYYESNGVITEDLFAEIDVAKDLLQDAMDTANTDWDPFTTSDLATAMINELDTSSISDDVYILAPADFISLSIRDVFNNMEGNTYQNMYITGKDGEEVTIASLMGDPINGHGTQTMTVFEDIKKQVGVSVGIAQNIIDGKDGLVGFDYTGEIAGVQTAYMPLDILLYDNPQHTYDLIFSTGYYDKNNDLYENIDFSQYED